MSAPQDHALPRDPTQYRPARAGPGVWSLLGLCALCILAGVGLALMLPRLLPMRTAEPASPAPAVAPPAPSQAIAAPSPQAEGEVARLNARIAALESQGARTSEAAAAALAAAALMEAAQSSEPFAAQLANLRAAAPGLPELSALSQVAQTGAPSRAALAASFPDFAARAAVEARRPGEKARLADRFTYLAARVVSVRKTDDLTGGGADAILARAERALGAGDLLAALEALEALPEPAARALAPWRSQAEQRAAIDRQVAALRARAVQELAEGGESAT